MERKEYEIMYEVEDFHWWYQGMNVIVRRLIEEFCWRGKTLRILDAGCGTGAGILTLSAYGNVVGVDVSPHAALLSRKRGHRDILRASVTALPFTDNSFDIVASLDILYFEGLNDEVALREAARVLAPGGNLVLRVPAFNWLKGIHDEKVSTGHRYSQNELLRKIEKSGLQVTFISYVNTLLFPLILLKRLCEKFLPQQVNSDITIDVGSFGALFKRFLVIESCVMTRLRLPFGVSIVAVGSKA
jgi:SAM-dependent methyltransferase